MREPAVRPETHDLYLRRRTSLFEQLMGIVRGRRSAPPVTKYWATGRSDREWATVWFEFQKIPR